MTEDGGTDACREPDQHENQNKPLSPHERLYHLTYGFGVSAAFSAADFAFLWPESHLGAFLFGAAILSILALYELTVVYPAPLWAKGFVIVVTWAASVVGYGIVGPILPAETEDHGWLLPGRDSTPENGCTRWHPDDPVLIVGGTSFPINVGKFTAVKVGECQALRMEIGPDGLLVHIDDYNSAGDLLFRIEGQNEFHVVPQHTAYPKRPDRSTITVIGEKGSELLTVKYANPKAIVVTGTFGCAGHDDVTISATEIRIGNQPVGMRGNCFGLAPGGIGLNIK